ncbi:hypothetical protein B566_EDAN002983 [Ephemera danica]|nr:hypothetical protein B566_EDAN002983 [Ephemera danica]
MEKKPIDELRQSKMDPIYSKVQIVYIKSKEKEERQRDLRVAIHLHTGVGPLGRQVLNLQLTDDEDPYFLFSLLVTEEDFKSLKLEQGLLVDFDHFPSQLVRLLEECIPDRERFSSRFTLILNEDAGEHSLPRKHTSLQFVETNEFKHLCHLSLRILPGSDTEIKKHMSQKISQLKEELHSTSNRLEQRSEMLKVAQEKLEAKHYELEENRVRVGEERSNLERRVLQEAAEAREALSKAHLEWQRRLEKERQDLEESKSRETKCLEEQLTELKMRNQLLSEKLMHTESSVRDLAKHADSAEKELKAAQKEISTLRKQNSQIDIDYHEKEKAVNNLRTKLAVLEQEMKDKNLLINKHQELLQVANEQKMQLEDAMAGKEAALNKKQQAQKNLSDDLAKANEIIAKQFGDLQTLKSKLQLRSEIALKVENVLASREKECDELKSKISALECKISELENAHKETQAALTKANEELENKEKALKNNENVITWLTRQMKETQTSNNYSARSALAPLLASSTSAPTTSTPNVGAVPMMPNSSSVHSYENSAEVRQTREMWLGLPDMLQMSDKQKSSPMIPLQEEKEETGSLLKGSLQTGDASSSTQTKNPSRTKGPFNKQVRPARHIPTSTTPAVKRTDILSSYFPKS